MRRIANTVVANPLITFREKDPETLKQKMQKKGVWSVFMIHDVYGIRVIVESVDDVYVVLEKIIEVFPGYIDHDYIKTAKKGPSVNGKVVRFLKLVAQKGGVSFEIQITTFIFHEVNELLHEGYHRRKYS
ncbi:MAG: hypothetical protein Q7K54_01795 [Candidatus Parcubacteria bacterium]|nr:hypothetical protein [Candidatus Parcubacteria bacterium]